MVSCRGTEKTYREAVFFDGKPMAILHCIYSCELEMWFETKVLWDLSCYIFFIFHCLILRMAIAVCTSDYVDHQVLKTVWHGLAK